MQPPPPLLTSVALAVLATQSCAYSPSAALSLVHLRPCFRRSRSTNRCKLKLEAAPKRLDENVDGVLYVNDRCINCAACSNFAPTVFKRNEGIYKHVVYNQPAINQKDELEAARVALAACPVAAIRVESNAIDEKDGRELKDALSLQHGEPFPRPIYSMKSSDEEQNQLGVYYLGHHNDKSFGAIPYLVQGKSPSGKDVSVMVDVPRFSQSAVRAVKSLTPTCPDYMFLTHVDDTADHNKWKKEFPALKRIFHSGDLGVHNWVGDLTLEHVEILLKEKTTIESNSAENDHFVAWDVDGNPCDFSEFEINGEEFLIVHTPGHSPGSICLLFRPKSYQSTEWSSSSNSDKQINGILFTGDTYAYTTRDGGHMSGFPRYGNNLQVQAESLTKLGKICHMWDIVAPGHGHVRTYLKNGVVEENEVVPRDTVKLNELKDALVELQSW